MAQLVAEKRHHWECPKCHSHYDSEPLTLGYQKGAVVRVHPICPRCFRFCPKCVDAHGNHTILFGYGEVHSCGAKRLKISLKKVEVDPEDPTFGFTETGSTSYPAVEAGVTSVGPNVSNVPNASYFVCVPFTLTQPLTVKEVHMYAHQACNVKAAVYTKSGGGNPDALKVANNTAVAVAGGTWGNRSLSATFLDTGEYFAGLKSDTNQSIRHAAAGSTSAYMAHAYATDFPDPCPAPYSWFSNWSVHVSGVEIQGYMYFTDATLADDADPIISVSCFCHAASGHLRKAIFDKSSPMVKMWESNTVPTVNNDWKVTGIAGGSPSSLALSAGDYALGWQYDGVGDVLSYTAGSAGDGFHKAQAFGPFPATISGETSNSKKWSMYVTYAVAPEEESEEEAQVLLAEGTNCHIIDYVEDYRQLATVIILKAGKDENGADIVVTVSDEEAAGQYGRLVLPFSESQWTTQVLAELRASQLLSIYKVPAVTISVEARDCYLKKGDSVTLVSATLSVNSVYIVESVDHEYGEEGPTMRLQLKNMTASILDMLNLMQRNLERR